ncbi:aminotransferase class I/II-fold pyridoxal phosphate-dependent enzyme [Thalassotalea profundi]|uniref:8-amino-7-oxononanoate synthase n=1 Tax=Thalassotalea profundi TaxID=2036687 RepID=A0ABQ3III6_9GAMM|nr:8-amino-7-oxononanoate synthase [Thalassotalea profundi]GHE82735.1 8-amino-7-oxononanoate synthase [Thalassotalea profundi]
MSFQFLVDSVKQQQQISLFRQRTVISEQFDNQIIIDGKSYLNFSSNDYLGLNNHPDINNALKEGANRFGTCASASSLITGYNYAHQALEETVCEWLNKPRCLLFSSGFAANTGVIQALAKNNIKFCLDKLSHASLIDSVIHDKNLFKRFAHNNYQQLDDLLEKHQDLDQIIVSEGVFSMDGDRADIVKLNQLAKKYQAKTYIDDAHAIGVIGNEGQGSSFYHLNDITMATFGKAVATNGAFITCDEEMFHYLINFSRHYIYSTAMSPAIAWATIKSIELIKKEHWRREKITELSQIFSANLDDKVKLLPTTSSIHAIVIGDAGKTLITANKLKSKGIWLTPIRPPTVAKQSSRLRVTINSNHKEKDIIYLAQCINEAII